MSAAGSLRLRLTRSHLGRLRVHRSRLEFVPVLNCSVSGVHYPRCIEIRECEHFHAHIYTEVVKRISQEHTGAHSVSLAVSDHSFLYPTASVGGALPSRLRHTHRQLSLYINPPTALRTGAPPIVGIVLGNSDILCTVRSRQH